MNLSWSLFISFLLFSCLIYSQENKQIQFKLLGQDDEVSFLSEKESKSVYEKLKWIDLKNNNSLSFGGSYRFQAESFINENFNHQGAQDNIWYLNRILLHALFKINQKFDAYIELSSSTAIGKTNVSPVDKDLLAVNQAFAAYHFNSNWSLLLGRENLGFGSRRLVDVREGPNVRRSFDLARIDYKNETTKLTTFFAIPVKNKEGAFDNDYVKSSETFSGVYLSKNFHKYINSDIYGFYQKDDDVTYAIGTADERRYTFGGRYFGSYKNVTFNNEAAYQLGLFGNNKINAYTLSLNAEYATKFIGDKTTIGLKTELISGDKNRNDNRLNTFDALYPRGAYFGRVARFGPSNLIDIHPYINTIYSKYYVEIDYDVFWRYSKNDGVYDAALFLQYPSTNTSAFIGHQIGTVTGCNFTNRLNIELETNIIIPGNFLKQNGATASLFHSVLTAEYKF
ncbi:alginate export family protein [Cellulophaga baltica]|uniref:alginate export family protein n=1 Tax=Cellulophaga baltica TaxID=76594 RepID=UPI00249553B0|nr:porin [Cellulophaga baltica]